jgi:hypothetical protein
LEGGTIFLFVMASLYGDDYGLVFDLTLGQHADVRYTYECPTVTKGATVMKGAPYKFETKPPPGSSNPQWQIPPGMQDNGVGLTGTPTETGTWYATVFVTCAYDDWGTALRNYQPYQIRVKVRVHRP